MVWSFAPGFDAAHRVALSDGKNLIYVCPPAAWAVEPLFARLSTAEGSGVHTLILVPDTTSGLDTGAITATLDPLRPCHVMTGLARTGRLLRADAIRALIATPTDALELVKRSILKLSTAPRVAVLWPELHFAVDAAGTIDTILGECSDAQRLIVTTDEAAIHEFVGRHAHRAPVVQASRFPVEPIGPGRYAVAERDRVMWAVRATLDILNPGSALVWDPHPSPDNRWAEFASDPTVRVSADPGGYPADLAVAVVLPSAEALTALRAAGTELVVLLRSTQLPYLQRLMRPLSLLRLSGEADRARDRAFHLRAALRERMDVAGRSGDLLALAPLFDEYDPALVAAAALQLGAGEDMADQRVSEDFPAWVRIHINAGKRDRVRTADIVGALLNAVGLPKDRIGRVEVRERYSLVEVRTEAAERALEGMDGLALRGHQVSARIDRR